MNKLKDKLLDSVKKGDLLQMIHEECSSGSDARCRVVEEVIKLHNESLLDIVSEFKQLKHQNTQGHNFFSTRRVFEKALPELNAQVLPVMECVLHLVNESGNDGAAGMIFKPYIDFCVADASRPQEALAIIESSIDKLADLLTATLVAGAQVETERFLNEAIRLTNHEDIAIRMRAVFSLGKIQYLGRSELSGQALASLETSVERETDDQLLGNIISSAINCWQPAKWDTY